MCLRENREERVNKIDEQRGKMKTILACANHVHFFWLMLAI